MGGCTLPGPVIPISVSPPLAQLRVSDSGGEISISKRARWVVRAQGVGHGSAGDDHWHQPWTALKEVLLAKRSMIFVQRSGSEARFRVRFAAQLRSATDLAEIEAERHGVVVTRVRSTLVRG